MREKDKSRYIIETVIQAGKVLEAVANSKEPVAPAEIVRATGLKQNTVFRLLKTLEELKYVRRIGGDRHELDMGLALFWSRYKSRRLDDRARINRELAELEIKKDSGQAGMTKGGQAGMTKGGQAGMTISDDS